MTVKGFGESEFWFSMVKVIAIVAFIIIGLAMIIKIRQQQPQPFQFLGKRIRQSLLHQSWLVNRLQKVPLSTCNQTDFLANLIILYPMYFHYRHPDCL
jgi:L-asparagine transporter-like permease